MPRNETPTALAFIELINLRLADIEVNAIQLFHINRLTDEQLKSLLQAKAIFGKAIEDILAEKQKRR